MNRSRLHLRARTFPALLALLLLACGGPAQEDTADVAGGDPGSSADAAARDARSTDGAGVDPGPKVDPGPGGDPGGGDASGDPGPGGDPGADATAPGWTRPAGSAALTFCVNDTANQTYGDAQILWTGSWAWNSGDNTIAFSSSWLPDQGPYPPLYDDGPISEGGHEAEGSTAGDHVFCAEIWFQPDPEKETVLEYGALDERKNWIWIGPNGQITVPAGSTDSLAAEGMKIPPFGSFDIEITVDLGALHADFSTISASTHDVFVKGTMNSWFPVQLLDNGILGDATAGDGIYTYVHSNFLGKHNGLLFAGQEAQFVFVFALSGISPDLGLEYKTSDGNAAPEGVKARSDFPAADGSSWVSEAVIMAPDSKGKTDNTALIVGDESLGLLCDPAALPCPAGKACEAGYCEDTPIGCGPGGKPCKPDETCENGICKPPPAPETVDEALLLPPFESTLFAGAALPDLRARVLEGGVTDGLGPADSLEAQFGIAPAGTSIADETAFGFAPATFVADEAGAEIYKAVGAAPTTPGAYMLVFRFRIDGGPWAIAGRSGEVDGSDPTTLGKIEVKALPANPVVDTIVPGVASVLGGTAVAFQGAGLSGGTFEATFDGASGILVGATPFALTFTAPGHGPGKVPLTLSIDGSPVTLPAQDFRYVLWATPAVDGTLSVAEGDWGAALSLGTNTVVSDWKPADSDDNALKTLYAAFDDTYLYLGIEGSVETLNTIVAYVDLDFGAATGFRGEGTLTDTSPALDQAIASMMESAPPGFGAELAFGTVGMKGYAAGGDLGDSASAGWRKITGLTDPADLWWLDADVRTDVGARTLEARIPLSLAFPAGVPADGTTVAILVRLGSENGAFMSNQGLPEIPAAEDPKKATAAATFRLEPVK